MRRLMVAALWTLGSGVAVAGQTPAAPGVQVPPTDSPAMRANLLPRPRVRIGEWLSLELIAKLQGDLARFDQVVDEEDEEFYWARRRLGIRGELWGRVGFEVERAFGFGEEPWRDVYLNVRASDLFEVRGGKFKVPFGLDNLTSSADNDFIYRALATRTLSPGRAIGGMAHGETDRRRFTYAIGVFDGRDVPSSDLVFDDDDQFGDIFGTTAGGRVTAQPFDTVERLPRGLRNMEFGANVVWSSMPAGLHGFRGRSVFGYEYFERVYVSGDRLRVGADVAVLAGPASLKAEWLNGSDDRHGQGLGDIDLPDVFGRGWYVAGTWLLTGEEKEEDVRPSRPFAQTRLRGAGSRRPLRADDLRQHRRPGRTGLRQSAGRQPAAQPRRGLDLRALVDPESLVQAAGQRHPGVVQRRRPGPDRRRAGALELRRPLPVRDVIDARRLPASP